MKDIIKIPTSNLGFFDVGELKKVSLGNSNNGRQREMASHLRDQIQARRSYRVWNFLLP